MDDIVAKLHEIMHYGTFAEDSVYGQAILDAADEIQRLQDELADWQRTVRYLAAEIASLSETKPRRLRKPVGTVHPLPQ